MKSTRLSLLKTACLRIIAFGTLCGIAMIVDASVSLERSIKEEPGNARLNAVSVLMAGNEDRLLLLDSEKGVLAEYKGKAVTQYNLTTKKVFESENIRGLARLDETHYLVSNVDDDVIAIIDGQGNMLQRIGESGSKEGQLNSPEGIAWSHNDRLYVADKGNNRISVYGQDGVFISAIGQSGLRGDERLDKPLQVYVDLNERIYVFEKRDNGRVSIFTHDGKLLAQLTKKDFNKLVNGNTEIVSITIDDKGLLYLADIENGRVLQVDWMAKKLLSSFGSKGEQRGQFEKISSMAMLPGNKLAVADVENKKIEIYRLPENDYKSLDKLYLPTVAYEQSIKLICSKAYRLQGGDVLCLDTENNNVATYKSSGKKVVDFKGEFSDLIAASIDDQDVIILDGEKIKYYKLDGEMRFEAGGSGDEDGKFDSPEGVFLSADKVYVADTDNERIQIFSRDGIYLNKIANPKDSDRIIFKRPTRVVTDDSNNIFVLDEEVRQVLVFSPGMDLLYRIGGKDIYHDIHDITIDDDGNLYILAATASNQATVQVFNGPTRIISFGSQVSGRTGLDEPVAISIPSANKTIVSIYDKELNELKNYKFKQLPPKPAGLRVQGSVDEVRLSWNKVPGSYTSRYKIYGAREKDGDYKYLTDVSGLTATIEKKGAFSPRFYRVGAVSGFSVEGEPSNIREDIFQAGYGSYKVGKYKKAVDLLSQSYQEDRTQGSVIKYLGLSLLELKEHDAALAYFTELSLIKGFEVDGYNLQIKALIENREFVSAKAVIDQLIAENTATLETIINCGELSLDLGDAIGAVDCLEDAIAKDSSSVKAHFLIAKAYIKLGLVDKGINEFTLAESISPDTAGVWYQSGLGYQRLARHTEAIERFAKAINIDSEHGGARLAMAQSYLANEDYDNVRNIAVKLAGIRDTETEGHYLLGITSYATQDYPQALLSLSKATRADKSNSIAWLALADTYAQLKQQDKIKSALESAVAGDARSFGAAYRLAEYEYDAGEYEKSAIFFYDASVLQPDNFSAQYQLAQALFKSGAYNKAARSADNAARLQPVNVDVMMLESEIFNKQGKNAEAIEKLKLAMNIKKNSPELYTRLGALYVELDLYDAASSALNTAVLLDKSAALPHVLLADLYMGRRMYDKAIAAMDKAVALDPSVENKLALAAAYAEQKRAIEFDKNAPKIVIKDLEIGRVFSAAYKRYADSPIGKVTIENSSDTDYVNIKLRFTIKDYMDFPTTIDIPLLKAKSKEVIDLNVVFNNRILEIDEDTGVQVEVAVNFSANNEADAIRIAKPITIYGKNAMVWQDLNMVGAFVTPKDDLLRDFVRPSLNENKPETGAVDSTVLTAMTLFDVFGAHGINYIVDPNSPYSELTESTVDYVQFPRETLKLKSGDCDDLSVLLSASLENLGIETAIIDVPGHLLMMFDTGLSASDRHMVSMDDDLLVIRDDKVWIPVEATMIGQNFAEAWTEGARKYHKYSAENSLKVVVLSRAWMSFKPVTLSPAAYTVAIPEKQRVMAKVQRETKLLIEKSLERLVKPYRALVSANETNIPARLQVAIIYAKYGLYDAANTEFDRILEYDTDNSAVYNNRGNIYLTQGDYERAIEDYGYAEKIAANDAGIKMNISMANYRLGHLQLARGKYQEAAMIDVKVKANFAGYIKLLNN